MHTALTIAGSDSGGGAGIQADLKTFQEYEVFGTSVITVLTAQNTYGVQDIFPETKEAVSAQLESVLSDIGAHAVKTGMLYSAEIIQTVAAALKKYDVDNIVVDPVMYAKGGAPLLRRDAMDALKQSLLPLASLVTPNVPEAEEILGGAKISTIAHMEEAASQICSLGCKAVLLKGGHLDGMQCTDIFYDGKQMHYFEARRILNKDTHGTGCTLSSAIAAGLARGLSMQESIQLAKRYITAAIAHPPHIGGGIGPVGHHAFRDAFNW